jgi:hypothetical protein
VQRVNFSTISFLWEDDEFERILKIVGRANSCHAVFECIWEIFTNVERSNSIRMVLILWDEDGFQFLRHFPWFRIRNREGAVDRDSNQGTCTDVT